MSKHYIGVDVGTGSARACIINEEGEIVADASKEISLWKPKEGYYDQSTTDIWNAVCTVVKSCLQKSSVDPESISGLGFDATCSLAVFDFDGKPVSVVPPDFNETSGDVRNVILWLDHRPEQETARINATKHNLLRYVGGTMSIEMEMPKVLWLKRNLPKDLFSKCIFYDLADALVHLATGFDARSFCSTVCKQGYVPVGVDGSVKGWQDDFLNAIGLEELCQDNFKRIGGVDGVNGRYLGAGEYVGCLSESAARELGLPSSVAVGSGVIDAYAGWVGTVGAGAEPHSNDPSSPHLSVSQAFTRLAAVAGTSTCHLAMSAEPVFVDGVWGPYRDVLLPNYWMAEGGQSATGLLLSHVIETHPAHSQALEQAKRANQSIYAFLNYRLEEMARKEEASNGNISWLGRHLFFYGDFFGNRSPIADPNMRGSIAGLSSDTSVDALALQYYGAMESIALQTRQIVERMNDSGHTIQSVFMSGSQCQNDILTQLISTACGMPVVIPRYVHAAVVCGAAMLGVRAASCRAGGEGEGLWSIMSRMTKIGWTVEPSRDRMVAGLLEAKYQIFLEQCASQRRWRSAVDDALNSSLEAETS